MDKLEEMFRVQDVMAARFIPIEKFAKREMSNADVQDWTLNYLNCAAEEVVEMRREYPRRKFWKRGNESKPHIEEKALMEFVDILHFLCAVARINAWDADVVFKAYMEKFHENEKRFAPTYSGDSVQIQQ